jgi:hypothetical protein
MSNDCCHDVNIFHSADEDAEDESNATADANTLHIEARESIAAALCIIRKELAKREEQVDDYEHQEMNMQAEHVSQSKSNPQELHCDGSSPITPASKHCDRYGTAASFRFDVLVEERQRHETEESKSSITARYRKAQAEAAVQQGVPITDSVFPSTTRSTEDATESSATMTMNLISQITRVVSDSLTGSAKSIASGTSERLARWRGAGIHPANEAPADNPVTHLTSVSTSRPTVTIDQAIAISRNKKEFTILMRKHGRKLLSLFQSRFADVAEFNFESAGVNSFYPLKIGSWVAVADKGALHIGSGMFNKAHQLNRC